MILVFLPIWFMLKMTVFLQFPLQCFTNTSAFIKSVGRSKIPQVNSLYPVCEKLELLLTGIKKNCNNIDIPTKCNDLLEKISSKPITQTCVNKKYKLCASLDTKAIHDCEKIALYIWKKGDKYYEKVLCEQTGEEV